MDTDEIVSLASVDLINDQMGDFSNDDDDWYRKLLIHGDGDVSALKVKSEPGCACGTDHFLGDDNSITGIEVKSEPGDSDNDHIEYPKECPNCPGHWYSTKSLYEQHLAEAKCAWAAPKLIENQHFSVQCPQANCSWHFNSIAALEIHLDKKLKRKFPPGTLAHHAVCAKANEIISGMHKSMQICKKTGNFLRGARVRVSGKWLGAIVSRNDDGTYVVMFDNCMKENRVARKDMTHILACNRFAPLRQNDRVLMSTGANSFKRGTFLGYASPSNASKCMVKLDFDDSATVECDGFLLESAEGPRTFTKGTTVLFRENDNTPWRRGRVERFLPNGSYQVTDSSDTAHNILSIPWFRMRKQTDFLTTMQGLPPSTYCAPGQTLLLPNGRLGVVQRICPQTNSVVFPDKKDGSATIFPPSLLRVIANPRQAATKHMLEHFTKQNLHLPFHSPNVGLPMPCRAEASMVKWRTYQGKIVGRHRNNTWDVKMVTGHMLRQVCFELIKNYNAVGDRFGDSVYLSRGGTYKLATNKQGHVPSVPAPASPKKPVLKKCLICFDDKITTSGGFARRIRCSHQFCAPCIKSYVESKLDSGWGDEALLTCPHPDCSLSVSTLALPVYVKNRYDRVANLRKNLHVFSRQCPKCNASNNGNPNESHIVCSSCNTKFCFKCNGTHSKFGICANSFEFSLFALTRNIKRCPCCYAYIHKQGGCPHMTCGKCGYYFCWGCQKGIYTGGNVRGINLTAKRFQSKCRGGIMCSDLMHHEIWGPNSAVRFVTKTVGFSALLAVGAAVCVPAGIAIAVKKTREYRENRRLLEAAARNRRLAEERRRRRRQLTNA